MVFQDLLSKGKKDRWREKRIMCNLKEMVEPFLELSIIATPSITPPTTILLPPSSPRYLQFARSGQLRIVVSLRYSRVLPTSRVFRWQRLYKMEKRFIILKYKLTISNLSVQEKTIYPSWIPSAEIFIYKLVRQLQSKGYYLIRFSIET